MDTGRGRGADRPPSVSRVGEWKLVWRPAKPEQAALPKPKPLNSASSTRSGHVQPLSKGVRRNWGPGSDPQARPKGPKSLSPLRASTRAAGKPPFGDSMTGVLTSGLLKTGIPGMTPPHRASAFRRPASVQGFVRADSQVERIATRGSGRSDVSYPMNRLQLPSRGPDVEMLGSQPASSTRSQLSTVSQQSLGSRSSARRERLGTGLSLHSQRSVSSLGSRVSGSYSAYSGMTSISQQDEILKRIQGLEEALNAERSLRLQMQEIIQTKVGSQIPTIKESET